MRRHWPAILLAVALAVAVSLGTWRFALLPWQRARVTAEALAAGLEAGSVDDSIFGGVGASAEVARIYAGMGSLRPTVEVSALERDADGVVRARFAWRWEVHAGKPAWEYTTDAALSADGGEWRVAWTPELVVPGLGADDALRATRLAPRRGRVLGQGGVPIAWNQPALVVGVDKTRTNLDTAVATAARVAGVLGVDAESLVARVRASGPRAFVEARVLRAGDPTEASLAREATRLIGVRALATERPLARTASFARPLLGRVAEATAEQVEASGGAIRAGDLVGRGGLQEARNHVLAGTTGFVVSVVDPHGVVREAFRVDALAGSDVATTLDVDLQAVADDLLAHAAPGGALVALRPSDGSVLAAASGPGSGGLSTATLGQYAPGSAFEPVVALARLRAGASGVDAPTLAGAAASLGLTAEPRLVVGGFLGSVPADATGADLEAARAGKGEVLVSPLGVANVAASVLAGRTVTPVLVPEPARSPAPGQGLSGTEASALRDLLGGGVAAGPWAVAARGDLVVVAFVEPGGTGAGLDAAGLDTAGLDAAGLAAEFWRVAVG